MRLGLQPSDEPCELNSAFQACALPPDRIHTAPWVLPGDVRFWARWGQRGAARECGESCGVVRGSSGAGAFDARGMQGGVPALRESTSHQAQRRLDATRWRGIKRGGVERRGVTWHGVAWRGTTEYDKRGDTGRKGARAMMDNSVGDAVENVIENAATKAVDSAGRSVVGGTAPEAPGEQPVGGAAANASAKPEAASTPDGDRLECVLGDSSGIVAEPDRRDAPSRDARTHAAEVLGVPFNAIDLPAQATSVESPANCVRKTS